MTAVTGFGTPGLTVLFVVGLDSGILGWFIASTIANAAAFIVALRLIPWNRHARINRTLVKGAILFALPLLPHLLSHIALQLADRGVIATMVNSADLGTYTLAANFGLPLMMLVIAVYQGFSPIYARAGADTRLGGELSHIVVAQIGAVVGLTLAGVLLAPPAIRALTPPEYHGAASIVGWILLGYGFLGVYFVPMAGASLGAGRTQFVWIASGHSAGLNIALLLAFVPSHGIRAAAIASAIGYVALLVLTSTWAHLGANPVTYRWRPIAVILATGVLIWLGARATETSDNAATIGIDVAWLVLFAVVTGLLVFRTQIRGQIRYLRSLRAATRNA
jgi:O-antigen/teichoic acid export membrane protein